MNWKEMMLQTRDGRQIPVQYTTNVLRKDGEFMGIVNFFQDLTEIKRLEKELVQSERLAAVGQTVSGLAHYVKNNSHRPQGRVLCGGCGDRKK